MKSSASSKKMRFLLFFVSLVLRALHADGKKKKKHSLKKAINEPPPVKTVTPAGDGSGSLADDRPSDRGSADSPILTGDGPVNLLDSVSFCGTVASLESKIEMAMAQREWEEEEEKKGSGSGNSNNEKNKKSPVKKKSVRARSAQDEPPALKQPGALQQQPGGGGGGGGGGNNNNKPPPGPTTLGCKALGYYHILVHFVVLIPDASERLTENTTIALMDTLNNGFRSTPFSFSLESTEEVVNAEYSQCIGSSAFQPRYHVDGTDRLTVYFCDLITRLGDAVGVAKLPVFANISAEAPFDGVMLTNPEKYSFNAQFVETIYQAFIHEVGHWLGLLHTFEDGCDGSVQFQVQDESNQFYYFAGDGVRDTPNHALPTRDIVSNRENCYLTPGGQPIPDTCPPRESTPGLFVHDKGKDPVRNYMNYLPPECLRGDKGLFTVGQTSRMIAQFEQYRFISGERSCPAPTISPSTLEPTGRPTPRPSASPSSRPSGSPTRYPTLRPTNRPTPTSAPTVSSSPTYHPGAPPPTPMCIHRVCSVRSDCCPVHPSHVRPHTCVRQSGMMGMPPRAGRCQLCRLENGGCNFDADCCPGLMCRMMRMGSRCTDT